MIDSLHRHRQAAREDQSNDHLGLKSGGYGLVTLHRPANVDDPTTLASLLKVLESLATELPLVFPVHPRTLASAERAGIRLEHPNSGGADPAGAPPTRGSSSSNPSPTSLS